MGLVIFWTLCLSLLLTLNGGESFYFSNKGNSFRNQGVSLRRTKLTPLQLLTPCERAVWSCCQTNRANYVLPVFCFEQNGCRGLQWLGPAACAPLTISSVGQKLMQLSQLPKWCKSNARFLFLHHFPFKKMWQNLTIHIFCYTLTNHQLFFCNKCDVTQRCSWGPGGPEPPPPPEFGR